MQKPKPLYKTYLTNILRKVSAAFASYWRKNIWHKAIVVLASIGLLCTGTMYGIAQWYIHSNDHKPLIVGASFIPTYAEHMGLDAQETMDALINDVGVRHFRLVSYWSQIESQQGTYDFSVLDWQFKKAEAADAKVTLSLGLRQPRWPECHMPEWAKNTSVDTWQPQLEAFMTAVVERYKDSPALGSYQVENEFFLRGFGDCELYPGSMNRDRLVREYNLVKKLDPNHTIIISRSNNLLGYPVGEPTPDMFGLSLYKRAWGSPPGRYVEYPFPAWYYGFLAGSQKLLTGRDMMIHELQAEAWAPNGKHVSEISIEEANKSFNAERFKNHFEHGKATGMREMYLWGAEYWYYRLVRQNDPTVWNVAKQIYKHPETTHPR